MLRGFFRNNCPVITLTLAGTSSETIEAIVDTGFNGSLTLPEHLAVRLGLTNTGAVSSSSIADGSSSPSIIYLGTAVCEGVRVLNTIVEVQPTCKTLLGMSLLKQLNLNLFVDLEADRVELNTSSKIKGLKGWLTRDF